MRSTITSVETAAKPPARTTAQSSPIQRTTREPSRRPIAAAMASISERSPMVKEEAGPEGPAPFSDGDRRSGLG